MKLEAFPCEINPRLLPYLVNGDPAGLTDEEIALCDDFADQYPLLSISTEGEPYFGRCEVLNEWGDVIECLCHFQEDPSNEPE